MSSVDVARTPAGAGVASVAAGLALGVGLAAAPAAAEPTTSVTKVSVLRMTSVADAEAMGSMRVGVPLAWLVTVTTAADEGIVTLSLRATGSDVDVFHRVVAACDQPWVGAACPGTRTAMLGDGPTSATDEMRLGDVPADVVTHVRVEVELAREAPGSWVSYDLVARGRGDTAAIPVGPGTEVRGPVTTGVGVGAPLARTAGAVLVGLTVAGAARRARREGDGP